MIIGISLAANETCPLYKCATDKLNDGICIKTYERNITGPDGIVYNQTVSDIDVTRCEKGVSYCPPNGVLLGETKCAIDPPGLMLDGDKCELPTNCYSGNCKDKKCIGLDDGALCDNTGACKIGSFCSGFNKTDPASICKQQIKDGDCVQTHDCVNSQFCNNKKCNNYFTLKTGTEINVAEVFACETGYIYQGKCTEFIFQGTDYKFSANNGVCKYLYTAENKTLEFTDGQCTYDGGINTKYCFHMGTNHPDVIEVNKKLKDWYNSGNSKLHSFRRGGYSHDLTTLQRKIVAWPHLNNASKCTVELLTGSGSIVTMSLFALFASLLLLF